jgi:hypothetical protein
MKPIIREVKPYTHKELSSYYGVCKQTFSKWLIPFQPQIGERKGHFYSVEQVKTIFRCLGMPFTMDDGG